MAAAEDKAGVDYSIKPEAVTPAIPTSEWPLLLKNYDKRVSLPPPNEYLFFFFFFFFFWKVSKI